MSAEPEKFLTEPARELSEDQFLAAASSRWKTSSSAEAKWRGDALADWTFRIGKQWPDDILEERARRGSPCLVLNRIPSFIRQITNEQRQSRPTVQISPVGSGADTDTAEIFEGLVRHIENNSDAEIADDTAFDAAVTGGFGFEEITTCYPEDDSFDQEIAIRRIKNPFSVYSDPSAKEPDGSDANYRFQVFEMATDDYKIQYPDSQLASLQEYSSIGDNFPGWIGEEKIRVAKYWHIEREVTTLWEQPDGSTGPDKPQQDRLDGREWRSRTLIKRTVYWSLINAVEVLEPRNATAKTYWGELWLGKSIPILQCMGEDLEVDGSRYIAGMVRDAQDPQRMYNYWSTKATETIALAPTSPFVALEGQTEGYEKEWQAANTRHMAVLPIKAVIVGGQLAPMPQRQTAEPPIQAVSSMMQHADYDLQAVTGRFNPSQGKPSSQAESGKAISALQRQSDVGSYNWGDNLARMIKCRGRLLVDLIPKIYDAPRVAHIVNPDGTKKAVAVHNSQMSGLSDADALLQLQQDQSTPDTIKQIYDLGVGRYDVTVSVGPSHQTKRQEAAAAQMQLVQAFPQIMAVCGDLLIGDMDWPQAKAIAQRLRKMLPPQLQDDGDEPEQIIAKLQSQLQAMGQQNGQLTQHLNAALQTIEQKRIENDVKIAIAKLQSETQVTVAEINTKSQESLERARMEQDIWKQIHDSAHDVGMAAQAATTAQQQLTAQAAQQPQNGNQPEGSQQ